MGTAAQDGEDHLPMEETEPLGGRHRSSDSEMKTHSTKGTTNF